MKGRGASLPTLAKLADALVSNRILMERMHATTVQIVALDAQVHRLESLFKTFDPEHIRRSLDDRLDDHNKQLVTLTNAVNALKPEKKRQPDALGLGAVFSDMFSDKKRRVDPRVRKIRKKARRK